MKEIAETGYWNAETAHIHHVHSPELSKWICNFFGDKKERIFDMGCGLGHYLKDLQDAGFTNLVGFEGDPPVNKVFMNIWRYDLTKPMSIISIEKGNVISLEVGEHIPSEFMDTYLDNVTNHCNKFLIMSWAVRGQAGFGHVNCLDNEEVIPLIEGRGFRYLPVISMAAREVIGNNTLWFKNTILIFEKC